ncbi:MAG: ferredoxin family protein [Syntrophaceae bacterium]|nr:ferredoxin family protein [Syntrophaceae bacterium]
MREFKDFEVYLVHVDEEKCVGCGECVRICQGDVFEISEKALPARPENCLGCQACLAVCETKAIILTEI